MNVTRWIRPIRDDERPALAQHVAESWGSRKVVSRGVVHDVASLDCLIQLQRNEWTGVAAYRVDGDQCELVLIEAFERNHGTGSALLNAVVDRARALGVRRLWLVTTNDNLDALGFYQRRGFTLVAVYPDAVTAARRLKPEIPLMGDNRIPIRDELELERWLDTREPAITKRAPTAS